MSDGKDLGFWVAGMAVYGTCCLIANLVVALKMNLHHVIGTIFFALMIIAYPLFYWLFDLLPGVIYRIFGYSLGLSLIHI